MPDITLTTLQSLKLKGEKIAMLTCYDATFAHASCQAGVEVLLVGDSLGMVLQGNDSTLPVTTDELAYHTASVKRGNDGAFIIADLPFMGYATLEQTFQNAGKLMQAGAHMIKVEGAVWLAESIRLLAERGVPVCAHMGLTPQSVNILGGYKVQGRNEAQARQMRADAIALEQAGAAMILLECVPSELAAEITQAVKVPVIGIGAGSATDGQVLVLHDMLGLSISGRVPKFVKNFLAGQDSIHAALSAYVAEVKGVTFPGAEHGFSARMRAERTGGRNHPGRQSAGDRDWRRLGHRWPGAGGARHARPVDQRSSAEIRQELHGRPGQHSRRIECLRCRSQRRDIPWR